MYIITEIRKEAQRDSFGQGCYGDILSSGISEIIKAETLRDLIADLKNLVGCLDNNSLTLDACEEKGRIDIQFLETSESSSPSDKDLKDWKDGKCDLWAVTYTVYVYKTELVSLSNYRH